MLVALLCSDDDQNQGNANNLLALAVVLDATLSKETPRNSAILSATFFT